MAVQNSLKNMVLCLFGITAVCAALLGTIYEVTKEPIAKAVADKNTRAIAQVCPGFDSLAECQKDGKSYYVATKTVQDTVARTDTVAYVVYASSVGFGGPLNLMVGFRPDGSIYNTVVLSHSETPGLGAKCTEASFADQFKGFDSVSGKLSVRKDGGDVDAITASTITSRAYCVALQNAVKAFRDITAKPAGGNDAFQCNEGQKDGGQQQ